MEEQASHSAPKKRTKKPKKNVRGLGIRTFNGWMIVIASVLFALLIAVTIYMTFRYNALIKASNDYIAAQADAAQLQKASDYLTEEVRLFTVNKDPQHANNYFQEVNETKRRENALEELKNHEVDDATRNDLELALKSSNDLMNREIYAMKLVFTACGYSDRQIPEEVQQVTLTQQDREKSSEEQLARAQDLVFNQGYQDAKALIVSHLSHFTNSILESTHDKQTESYDKLTAAIAEQSVFICLLFIMNVVTFVVITMLIVRPLKIYIRCIQDKKLFQVIGSSEFKYMALTYNNIYELNAANEAMLRYKAEHDPLTDILNRSSFMQLQTVLKNSNTPLALMLVDVDEFKQINDTYGHDVGDRILQKVANLLQHTFHSSDYPIRIGGDEFAVILMNTTEEEREIIAHKVQRINNTLQNPTDGLPKASVSIGIAFSPEGFTDTLYRNADSALYLVKENGRKGFRFYEP